MNTAKKTSNLTFSRYRLIEFCFGKKIHKGEESLTDNLKNLQAFWVDIAQSLPVFFHQFFFSDFVFPLKVRPNNLNKRGKFCLIRFQFVYYLRNAIERHKRSRKLLIIFHLLLIMFVIDYGTSVNFT